MIAHLRLDLAHQEGQSLRATLRWLARLRRLQACLAFLQHANNLFFGESFLHDHSFSEWTLHRHRTNLGEQVKIWWESDCRFPLFTNRR
ncbi:hypothetical protein SAMN04487769_2877 [Burkholderia sp. b14]|nr:hypothetical protein SAMN04487769_2877 [Burkholderia sp. b14]